MKFVDEAWFGTAVLGAIIAALGYVLKLISDLIQAHLEKRRLRRSALVELRSLLRAAKVAFNVQNTHARNLISSRVKSKIPRDEGT